MTGRAPPAGDLSGFGGMKGVVGRDAIENYRLLDADDVEISVLDDVDGH